LQRLGLGRLFATSVLYLCLSAALALLLGLALPSILRQSSELWTRFFDDIYYYDSDGDRHLDKDEPILTRIQEDERVLYVIDRNGDGELQPGETYYDLEPVTSEGPGVRQERSLMRQGLDWAQSTPWRMELLLDRPPESRPMRFLAFYLQQTKEEREALEYGLKGALDWSPDTAWQLPPVEGQQKSWNPDWPGPSKQLVDQTAERLPEPLRTRWMARMVLHGQALAGKHQSLLAAWREVRENERATGTVMAEELRSVLSSPLISTASDEAAAYLERLRASEQESERQLLRSLYETVEDEAGHPLQQAMDQLRGVVGNRIAALPALAGQSATAALDNVGAILGLGLAVILVPIYAFFLTLGMPGVRATLRKYAPTRGRARLFRLTHEIERIVAAFFRGRLIVCLVCGLLVAAGFIALDVPYALLFGFAIGLATAIPLSGLLFLVPAMLLVLAEGGDGLLLRSSLVLAVYAVVQTLEATVFTPWIMGREVELHPVVLILALVFLGSLMGILGLLLAVPIAATLRILLREFALPQVRSMAGVPVTRRYEKVTTSQAEDEHAE
ncbi:MAG: AI-2E family transporter, partial [Planctomycetota bacterium]